MELMTHWILDAAGEPQRIDDILEWARWMQTAHRHVAQDKDESQGLDGVHVSTVFLGLDHSFMPGATPVLWETLVFGGPLDGEMQRYTSREEAYRGHQAMCERCKIASAEIHRDPSRGGGRESL